MENRILVNIFLYLKWQEHKDSNCFNANNEMCPCVIGKISCYKDTADIITPYLFSDIYHSIATQLVTWEHKFCKILHMNKLQTLYIKFISEQNKQSQHFNQGFNGINTITELAVWLSSQILIYWRQSIKHNQFNLHFLLYIYIQFDCRVYHEWQCRLSNTIFPVRL